MNSWYNPGSVQAIPFVPRPPQPLGKAALTVLALDIPVGARWRGLGMADEVWDKSELLTLRQAAELLRRAHKPRHIQSLYERIRRGTLCAVKVDGVWFIPKPYVQQLVREPYRRTGGRPRIKDTRLAVRRKTRRGVQPPDWVEAARLVKVPVEKRLRAGLSMQLDVRNLVRARLERQFPRLSRAEITLKVIAEFERDG